MDTDNTTFLSNIVGYVFPQGSHHDPEGLEGLSNAFAASYKYGTKQHQNSLELFTELEKTGALFKTRSGEENTYFYLIAPKENIKEATEILTHIIKDVETSFEDVEKIKELLKVRIDDLQTSPERYAKVRYSNLVLKERSSDGTKGSVEKIQLNDIQKFQKKAAQEKFKFSMNDPSNLDFDVSYPVSDEYLKDFEIELDSNALILEKDLEQKVVFLGFRTGGVDTDDYAVRQVASSVMGGGFAGIVVDEIREKNSAAYYASYSHELMSTKGTAFMYAGVSEENLPKTVQLMFEIFERGVNGDIDEETLTVGKEYFLGRLDRTYDSLESLAMSKLWFEVNGRRMPEYNDLVDQIRRVTVDQVSEYFKKFVDKDSAYLTVNGKLSEDTRSKLNRYFKDV